MSDRRPSPSGAQGSGCLCILRLRPGSRPVPGEQTDGSGRRRALASRLVSEDAINNTGAGEKSKRNFLVKKKKKSKPLPFQKTTGFTTGGDLLPSYCGGRCWCWAPTAAGAGRVPAGQCQVVGSALAAVCCCVYGNKTSRFGTQCPVQMLVFFLFELTYFFQNRNIILFDLRSRIQSQSKKLFPW